MRNAALCTSRSLLLNFLPVAAACLALAATTKAEIVSQGVYTLYSFTGLGGGGYPHGGLIQASDGLFYGTTYYGGSNNYGLVFQISANGAFTPLHSFSYTDGEYPNAGLIQGSDGSLYGTTIEGGSNYYGTVFRITTNGAFASIFSFDYTDGGYVYGGLVQASDGNLYGTTYAGGTYDYGTIFQLTTNGAFTPVWSFSYDDGANPYSGLVQGSDGNLYGTTDGGTNDYGTIFEITTNGTFNSVYQFGYTNGAYPEDTLIQASDGNLYGTTYEGGTEDRGTIFAYSTNGTLNTLFSFNYEGGEYPYSSLLQGSDGNFYGTTYYGGTYGYGVLYEITSNASYTTLYSFTGTGGDGANPYAGLIQAANGNLYGTTYEGGADNYGAIMVVDALHITPSSLLFTFPAGGPVTGLSGNITLNSLGNIAWGASNPSNFLNLSVSNGTLTPGSPLSLTLSPNSAAANLPPGFYSVMLGFTNLTDGVVQTVQVDLQVLLSPFASFPGNDGENPDAGVILASDGKLYGTTFDGGSFGYGTVFQCSTEGTLNILYSFTGGNDGAYPYAGLIQASDGQLYGTASEGGTFGNGTVFRIQTDGTLMPLYSFTGQNDGGDPAASLIQANDNYLYGTCAGGGSNGLGTVFQISTSGSFTALYSFTGVGDAAVPYASLVQAGDGNLYGTAYGNTLFGAIFRISTNGAFDLLYSFNGADDGAEPEAALVQASDGLLYGTASAGGEIGLGTVFRISTGGGFDPLLSFNDTDGAIPGTALFQAADGWLYGTTSAGNGRGANGTVFRVSTNGVYNTVLLFNGTDGNDSFGNLVQGSDGSLYGTTYLGGFDNVGVVYKASTSGSVTVLHSFLNPVAPDPLGGLIVSGGNLYGTTENGGNAEGGSVYEVTPNGAVTTLYSLSYGTGYAPEAGLIVAGDGSFYGTTTAGGNYGEGTIFQLSADGVLNVLHSFVYSDGSDPSSLIEASDGYLYGTTYEGGPYGMGTIFRISTNGDFSVLYSFNGDEGGYPEAGLVQAGNGELYGTTHIGGLDGEGAVFRFSTNNQYALLHSFDYDDGAYPAAALVVAGNGDLYGTTSEGGTDGAGTIFQITTNGMFTSIYSFTGEFDGSDPNSSLTLANNGDLYGTAASGGADGDGTVFQITTGGTLTPIYSFSGGIDGSDPVGGVVQASDGYLYGVTENGGANNNGAVYRLPIPGETIVEAVTIEYLPPSDGVFSLTFPTTQGQSYTIQENTNLASTNWLLYTNFIGNGQPVNLVIPTTNDNGAFFRVTEP